MSTEWDMDIRVFIDPIFFGGTISYVMYGTNFGQASWYFRNSKDSWALRVLVGLICLTETVNAALLLPDMWHFLIRRGLDMPMLEFLLCDHWTMVSQFVPTELTCFLVECFFLMRMWRVSSRKLLVFIATAPFVLGWGFNIAYVIGMFKILCWPEMMANRPWMFAAYGFRIVSDGCIAITMCVMLFRRRALASQYTSSHKMIRSLIVWTLATGLLMWVSAIAFIVTYIVMSKSLVSVAVYFIRPRIYATTMLSLLNHRDSFRAVADETVPLEMREGSAKDEIIEAETAVSTVILHKDSSIHK
ncbi:hypothetical protein BDQ12DRAFT_683391 [Crucibulum laeve]|uniref:DUF6534 domain-containing protein n=1 Tax=Crucibulum laeve TaxID=68775 RepID=A0A5C3M3Q4_9AGAR|nr:hypothetical protein BDQ12DRAFT_683391 [Crucibulum laeve]